MYTWYDIHDFKYQEYFSNMGVMAYSIMEHLFPICRSITGQGVKDTLSYLSNIIPITIYSTNTGNKHFDWEIPNEWSLREAYIIDPSGNVLLSSKINNLHVINYSTSIDTEINLDELKQHIYCSKNIPDAIPYITSYYQDRWGFCMSYDMMNKLSEGKYKVKIDVDFGPGSMQYADFKIKGKEDKEIMISTYFCHPSMANDNLSGLILTTLVLKELSQIKDLRYSYRGIFVPETIGSIVYLDKFGKDVKEKNYVGLVATCVGDNGEIINYKKTKHGNSDIDRAIIHLLKMTSRKHKILDFVPIGSDERQYSSPGIDISVGSLMRTYYYDFPYYHTSKDNMDIISSDNMGEMIWLYLQSFGILENNYKWIRTDGGFCEPQLGKRNLYPTLGGDSKTRLSSINISWSLMLADGKHDTLSIAEKANAPVWEIAYILRQLEDEGLVKKLI